MHKHTTIHIHMHKQTHRHVNGGDEDDGARRGRGHS